MIRKAMRIAAIQFSKERFSPKNICVFIILFIYVWCLMEPINRFAADYGCKVAPYGAIFIFSDIGSQVVLAIGAVFLFCNAPYRDRDYPYLVLRSGTNSFTIGNALYMAEMAGVYVLFMIFSGVLPSLGNIDWTCTWGKVWTTLARTQISGDYAILFQVTNGILSHFSPLEALVLSVFLEWLCFSLIGFTVYLGNLAEGRIVGTLMGTFWAFYDLIIYNMLSHSYYRFSPVSLARLSLTYEGTGITLDYAMCALLIGCAVMVCLCCFAEKKRKNGGRTR